MNWERVGRAIEDRINELGLTKAQVIRRSRVSDKTLNDYIAGQPIIRADKAAGLAAALGWTRDSFDRLARGESAQEVGGTSEAVPGIVDRIARLEERFDQFEELLRSAVSRRDG